MDCWLFSMESKNLCCLQGIKKRSKIIILKADKSNKPFCMYVHCGQILFWPFWPIYLVIVWYFQSSIHNERKVLLVLFQAYSYCSSFAYNDFYKYLKIKKEYDSCINTKKLMLCPICWYWWRRIDILNDFLIADRVTIDLSPLKNLVKIRKILREVLLTFHDFTCIIIRVKYRFGSRST